MVTDQQSLNALDANYLDRIINKMVDTVSESKGHIFEIGEHSRQEYTTLLTELENIKDQVTETIDRYDKLEIQARQARGKLAEVSKHFHRFSEEDIRSAYERANSIQVEMSIIHETEKQLRARRNDIERRVQSLKETNEKADMLGSQVSVVLNYLTGDLKKMGELIEDAKEKQAFGLRIIEAQEEERKRLSREIHDGPAQLLAHVLLGYEIVERVHQTQDPEATAREIAKFRNIVRNALVEVRRIIYDLRPMTLDDLGLIPTLQRYVKRLEEQYNGIIIDFKVIGKEYRLPSDMEVALFRLTQEAVQNACKHAKATEIKVSIECRANKIILLIKDDGQGFDPQKKSDKSFGLIGMKERVELLEGSIKVSSEINKGTQIFIQIPIHKEEEA